MTRIRRPCRVMIIPCFRSSNGPSIAFICIAFAYRLATHTRARRSRGGRLRVRFIFYLYPSRPKKARLFFGFCYRLHATHYTVLISLSSMHSSAEGGSGAGPELCPVSPPSPESDGQSHPVRQSICFLRFSRSFLSLYPPRPNKAPGIGGEGRERTWTQ